MQCDSTLLLMLQNPGDYPQESYDATVISLIHEMRDAIAKKVKEQGAIITDDKFVIGHLYPSKVPSTDSDFLALRQEAIDAISNLVVYEGESCEVVFSKPEAIVTDTKGLVTKGFDTVVRIKAQGLRKRKEV